MGNIKISTILTVLAFAMIGYLLYIRFILEEPVNTNVLIAAALFAIISSVLRRRGK